MNGHKHSHNSSQRDGGAPRDRRQSQFNSIRTAWLLSVLLMLTIVSLFLLADAQLLDVLEILSTCALYVFCIDYINCRSHNLY